MSVDPSTVEGALALTDACVPSATAQTALAAEVRRLQALAHVALDLHDVLGVPFGENPYEKIEQLQALAKPDAESAAARSVMDERLRQDAKWGEQNHDPSTYLTILMEEVGEYAQAVLETRFGGPHGGEDKMRAEAVQVAAVALAIVECLDRGTWLWPFLSPPASPTKEGA
jgi:NTP pyrophosphatase (non-canonical NTP hydrolase)